MCPAVLLKTRVCGGCSVSRAHKTFLSSILFCTCLYPRPLSRGGHFISGIFLLRTRLAVHKQSFLNLLRQNGRRVTKVYCFSLFPYLKLLICGSLYAEKKGLSTEPLLTTRITVLPLHVFYSFRRRRDFGEG